MRIKFIIGCMVGWILGLSLMKAQTTETGYSGVELSLKHRFDSIRSLTDDSVRILEMKKFQLDFATLLKKTATYTFSFDSLNKVGKVKSPDNAFRILTWNILLGTEHTQSFGIIQMNPGKSAESMVYLLNDLTDPDSIKDSGIGLNQWYGALYYKIMLNTLGDKKFYTLLGFDSFSPYVSKKIIDVLTFDHDLPMLGAPIFQMNGKAQSRLVFSFSAHVTMMLNYDEQKKMILFDHLSPTDNQYMGQYEYYGPDFSYDGFIFGKTGWQYVPTVNSVDPRKNKSKSRK